MDHEGAMNYVGYDSNFLGAILMSNREIKNECLRRKLFGLPPQMTNFIKKVKAGMLLFLFEYEERKLYGVFEATSDGALNIMPDAFTSLGKFPAQILFKRLWMCKPLSEDEFYDAIKDNYFSSYKFRFYLSYEQVFKLLQLFSSKKIGLEQCQRPVIRNAVLKEFEKSTLGEFRRTERGRHMKSGTLEHGWNNYSRRYSSWSFPNTSRFVCNHKPALTSADSVVRAERGFYPAFHGARGQHLHSYMNSTSQNDHGHRHNALSCDHCYHQMFSSSGVDLSSFALAVSRPSLVKEHTAGTRSLKSQAFRIRKEVNQSKPDRTSVRLLSDNCTCCMNVAANSRTQKDSSFPINELSKVGLSFPDLANRASLEDYETLPLSDPFDPIDLAISLSTPVTAETDGTGSLYSMSSLSYAHCNLEASNLKDGSREDLELNSSVDFIPLPKDEDFAKSMESSPPSTSLQEHPLYKKNTSEPEDDYEVYYPSIVTSGFHSDNFQDRASVFSRLLKSPEAPQPAKKDRDLSFEQLSKLLSQRRNQWSNMTKVAKRSFLQDDKNKMEKMKRIKQSRPSLEELESSRKVLCTAERRKLPLWNHKRKNVVQKMVAEVGTSSHISSGKESLEYS